MFGDCIEIKGNVVESPSSGQKIELKASEVKILGKSDIEVKRIPNKLVFSPLYHAKQINLF